ncbi:MAG: hypothetical protein LBJ76_06770, partial [Candidatus Accumulibacter sp.]|nr:hypothetical protein [Accumulibacter sp.]
MWLCARCPSRGETFLGPSRVILAFVLYKYFPFGGLQRDFLRISQECLRRGHAVRVYVLAWAGVIPEGFDVRVAP